MTGQVEKEIFQVGCLHLQLIQIGTGTFQILEKLIKGNFQGIFDTQTAAFNKFEYTIQ